MSGFVRRVVIYTKVLKDSLSSVHIGIYKVISI